LFTACTGLLLSCQLPDHALIHPTTVPPQVSTWSEEVKKGLLSIHLEWAQPAGSGPFPAVLVHPDGGSTATKMRGVIWDLAQHGYLAVAVDYRRLQQGTYRRTLFPWRDQTEVTTALGLLRAHPLVDTGRLAALGFSQGGVFSLLIAAHSADIRAVIAYYPVTDFAQWFAYRRSNPLQRLAFRVIRWHFRQQSEAHNAAEFDVILRQASPLHQAERILAPVLLIHGSRDGIAPVEESRRLAARLAALGREVELLVLEGGLHVFNFKQPEQATRAWQATLRWLTCHLGFEQNQSTAAVSIP
jgi:dipeptidyl aminopeptidase/acylaminoacyl peptidase